MPQKRSDLAHSGSNGEKIYKTTTEVLWKTLTMGHNISLVCVSPDISTSPVRLGVRPFFSDQSVIVGS
jgi:hypothetical protein